MNFRIPYFIQLRDYQLEAINSWFSNQNQGLLEMATGTGKTITALALAAKLYGTQKRMNIVIVTPFSQLSSQWLKECRNFGLSPIKAFGESKKWSPQLDNSLRAFRKGLTI